jgi:hypothetical protein
VDSERELASGERRPGVSAGSQVTVLGFRRWTASGGERAVPAERPLVRLAAFAALALWGTSRWATLMSPAPAARLYGTAAVAVVVAGTGREVARRSRLLAVALALVAAVAMLAIAGIPLEWIRHVRITVGGNAIGQGLSALPNVLVPYLGINQWVRVVIVLGSAVLLLDAALLVALTPRPRGDLRRAGAALPLVALAIVPATIVRPGLPYLQGIVLFVLLAAFMWGERAPVRDGWTAIAVVGAVALGAIIAAPRIDPRSAWVDYRALAGSLAPKHIDHFDWTQRYGPLAWPRDNRVVLDVKAAQPDYWKAQNLDVFDGRAWAAQGTNFSGSPPAPVASARAKWTQSLQVTIEAMKTTTVIAAGTASQPAHVPEGVAPGISPGTWIAGALLGPGASYTVTTYSPHPSGSQLASAGAAYPAGALAGDMSIELPRTARTIGNAPEVTFLPFHAARAAVTVVPGPRAKSPSRLIESSPYAPAYTLARRLATSAVTPYAFVQSVMHHLSKGFTYDEHAPPARYPLISFLFGTKHGYCQQFAGAMALLLRMGGVPARVAVGFTPGNFDKATGEWQVSDIDAHAWVEAWFPRYGWVRFDPTPAIAPARGGKAGPLDKGAILGGGQANSSKTHDITGKQGSTTAGRHPAGSNHDALLVVLGLLLAAGALALLRARRAGEPSGEDLLSELERALRRCGRPIVDGVTLAALEHRFRSSSGAQAYVRAIRLKRFGRDDGSPTPAERRALRAQLASGLGVTGRLRALWALPPRPAPRSRGRRGGDVQSA